MTGQAWIDAGMVLRTIFDALVDRDEAGPIVHFLQDHSLQENLVASRIGRTRLDRGASAKHGVGTAENRVGRKVWLRNLHRHLDIALGIFADEQIAQPGTRLHVDEEDFRSWPRSPQHSQWTLQSGWAGCYRLSLPGS